MRRFNPLMNLDDARERMEYLRLVLFVTLMRNKSIQTLVRQALHHTPGALPQGTTDEVAEEAFEKLVADVTKIDLNHEPTAMSGGDLLTTASGTPSAPMYDLRHVGPYAWALEDLLRLVRRLPLSAFFEEARPSAEFVVRCINIAEDPANQPST